MRGIFVTATGTGVGKTLISCGIARYLKNNGTDIGVMKPVASGGVWRKIGNKKLLVSEDTLLLKGAAKSQDKIELINPICFKVPLAPYSASLLEKRSFSIEKILSAFREIKNRHSFTIVEGIGGVSVPLSNTLSVSDLIQKMNLPALVVTSAKLGTLNHTHLTLEHLAGKKIKVLGIILNFFDPKNLTDKSNLDFFKRKKIPVLATLPKNPQFSKEVDLVAHSLFKNSSLSSLLNI